MADRTTARPRASAADSVEAAPSPQRVRVMAILVWVTTVAIFCQAIIAGQFVSQDGKDGWISVHGVVADVSWMLTLVSAAYAFFALRQRFPVLVGWTAILFVATLLQTGSATSSLRRAWTR